MIEHLLALRISGIKPQAVFIFQNGWEDEWEEFPAVVIHPDDVASVNLLWAKDLRIHCSGSDSEALYRLYSRLKTLGSRVIATFDENGSCVVLDSFAGI